MEYQWTRGVQGNCQVRDIDADTVGLSIIKTRTLLQKVEVRQGSCIALFPSDLWKLH